MRWHCVASALRRDRRALSSASQMSAVKCLASTIPFDVAMMRRSRGRPLLGACHVRGRDHEGTVGQLQERGRVIAQEDMIAESRVCWKAR